MTVITSFRQASSSPTDEEVVRRVVAGEAALFAMLMRRHNRRVYRTVRGILRDDTEAEDVAQDVWIAAYRALESFEGRAAFSTWLTRIAIRRALARASRAREVRTLDELDQLSLSDDAPGPDWETYRHEIARVLEAARRDP